MIGHRLLAITNVYQCAHHNTMLAHWAHNASHVVVDAQHAYHHPIAAFACHHTIYIQLIVAAIQHVRASPHTHIYTQMGVQSCIECASCAIGQCVGVARQ